MTGGWAAKELTEAGLRTLVLERGRPVEHVKDYPTAALDPWDLPYGNLPTQQDLAGLPDPEAALLLVRPGREALPGEGRRASLRAGEAVQLVSRLPGGRALAALVAALLPLERPRLRGEPEGGSRHRLAAALQGHRPLVRPRPGLHRHQRREGGPAPAPRRRPPAALRDELLRAAPAPEHLELVPRAEPDHEPRGGADAAAQRARRLPGPRPLPPRLPLRGVLLEQLLDAARGRGHRPPHAASALDRPQPDHRPRERVARKACA